MRGKLSMKTSVKLLQELVYASDFFDEDNCFVEYDIHKEEFYLYYECNYQKNSRETEAVTRRVFWKVTFTNCHKLVFCDCAADLRYLYERNKEVYHPNHYLRYSDFGMREVELSEHEGNILADIGAEYFYVHLQSGDVKVSLEYLPTYKIQLELINYKKYDLSDELVGIQETVTKFLNYKVLDIQMRYFLDDLELILEGPNHILYYLCLGKCQSLILSSTLETDLDIAFSYVNSYDIPKLLEQKLGIELPRLETNYIQSIFNLAGKQYQLLFQFVEVGELPQDVTTFDHAFFYENNILE